MEKDLAMIEALKELLDKDPFQPFRIVTSSGDKYEITNPHLVAIGKDTTFVFDPQDHFWFIRNNQITAVESVRSAA